MNPNNFHIGAGSLTIDGVDIGATTPEGIVVNYEANVHEHMSGKFGMTPVKATFIGARLTIKVFMAETTIENMAKVLPGVTFSTGELKFGGVAGREVVGKELVLTPYDGTEPWTFKKAVPTGQIEIAYQVENERVFEVTFVALVDTGEATGEELASYVS